MIAFRSLDDRLCFSNLDRTAETRFPWRDEG
jgi:hypothetical protein